MLLHLCQDRAHRNFRTFTATYPDDRPAARRGNIKNSLIRDQLDHIIVTRDPLALLEDPAHDLGMVNALTQFGKNDLYHGTP